MLFLIHYILIFIFYIIFKCETKDNIVPNEETVADIIANRENIPVKSILSNLIKAY